MSNETTTRTAAPITSPLTAQEAPAALVQQIGNTTFDIHIHFSQTSKETFTDKVIRLIQNDVEAQTD